MIITERQEADLQVDKIIEVIKQKKLNYFIEQSPFSLCIKLKKRLLHDFSPASKIKATSPIENQHSVALNDRYGEVKNELIKTGLEVKDLKEQNEKKDHTITKLEAKVKQMERKEDLLKKELICIY